MILRIAGSLLISLVFFTHSAFAEDRVEFDDTRYEVYYGDVDNDGDGTDIYFRGLKRWIIIHGDIAIPILGTPRDSYALIRTGGGYLYQKIDPAVAESRLSGFRRLTLGRDIYHADFDGNGSLDAFIRGADASSPAALVHGDKPYSEALAVVYEGAYGTDGDNLSDRARSISVKDVNRDGRVDLVLTSATEGYAGLAFLNSSAGFPYEKSLDLNPSTFAASLVGATQAEFRVNEAGAATYNIPIYTPRGVAGVAPSVSIDYSSAGGNGLMGIGWNLSAASSIGRCRPTLFQDGEALPITLTASDRFCLDGQRLMVQGSDTYGAIDAVYKTEIDNFEYIKSVGGSVGNPSHFIIIGKDGSKRTYGGTVDSRQEVGGATLTWSLSELVDNTGQTSNKIHFSYAGDAQGFRLTKIEYANKKVEIDFGYEDRRDLLVSYTGGHKLTADQRLNKVTVKDDSILIREYHVRYQNLIEGNEYSRVASVQECTAVNSACLPPLSFDWEMQDLSVSDNRTFLTDLTPSTTHTTCEPGYAVGCIPVSDSTEYSLVDYKTTDINGDNCLDLVYSLYHRSKREFTVGYRKADSTCAGFSAGRFGGVESPAPHYLKYDISQSQNTAQLNIIDYNSDGRSDLAIKREEDGDWDIHLAKPTADGEWFISHSPDAKANKNAQFFIDMDADALPDAVWFDDRTIYSVKMRRPSTAGNPQKPNSYFSGPSEYTLPTTYFPSSPDEKCPGRDVFSRQWSEFPEKPIIGDFNGDGKLDFGAYFRASTRCRNNNGPGPGPIPYQAQKSSAGLDYDESSESSKQLAGSSVAASTTYTTYTTTKLVILTLDGRSWKKLEDVNLGTSTTGTLPAYVMAQDLNSDGLTDLLYRITNQTKFLLSNGTTFEWAKNTSVPRQVEDKNLGFHDYNSDGYADLYYSYNRRMNVMTWNVVDEQFNEAIYLGGIGEKDAFFFADADGDGINDQFIVTNGLETESPSIKKLYIKRERSNGVHNKIARYDNGFGSETIISYKRLNEEGEHYARKEVGYSDTPHSFTRNFCEPRDGGEPGCIWRTETITNIISDPTQYYRELYNPFGLPGGSNELAKPVFDLNPSIHVVTRVQSTSPTSANLNAKAAVSYRYSEAKAQAGGRGYLGFRTVTTIDEQTLIQTESEYYQRFPLSGQPKATVVKDSSGAVMSEAYNFYPHPTADASKVYQVFLEQSVERQYAAQTNLDSAGKFITTDELLVETVTTQAHDDYGNVTRLEIETNGNVKNPDDEIESFSQTKIVESSYSNSSGASLNLHGVSLSYEQLGRLTSSTTTGTRNGEAKLEKRVSFTYRSDGLLQTETVEPDLSGDEQKKFHRVTTHSYDRFGNEVRTEVKAWDGEEIVTRLSFVGFDMQGRFVISKHDGLKQRIETYSNFNRFGSPRTITGANGAVAYVEYDELNRQITASSNTASAITATTRYLSCAQISGCPRGAVYALFQEVDRNADSREYYDALGRAIRSAKQNFHGRWVYVDTQYDILGRAIAVSEPHEGRAVYWTKSQYDDLGRVTEIKVPAKSDHNGGVAVSTFSYDGAKSTATNPLGRSKVEVKNSFGELVWVRDEIEGEEHAYLKYYYNSEGNMRRIEKFSSDGSVITTSFDYDRHNRKVEMQDPDKGTWIYSYNAFGELITQVDAKGQVVINRYDSLGRMLSRTDRHKSNTSDQLAGAVEAHTRWYYDGNTDRTNVTVANAVSQVSAIVMSRTTGDHTCAANDSNILQCQYPKYDEFGRPVETSSYVDSDLDSSTGLEMFTASSVYDFDTGRVLESYDAMNGIVTDANQALISGTSNSYNAYGYLEATHDLQTGTLLYETKRVNVRGQVVEANLGPYSRYMQYDDATGQMERQVAYYGGLAANAEPNAFTLQYQTYEWDVLGNLESRHNQSKDGSSGGNNLDLQESFCYDSLNRLIKTYVGNLNGSCENLALDDQDTRYNSIGNITFKHDVGNYDYDPVKKHAVRDAGNTRFWYDNNGNVERDTVRTFSYSTFDKPVLISKPGYSAAFAYGIDRSRYVQREVKDGQTQKITAYLGNIERIYRPSDGTYEWRRQVGSGLIKTTTNSSFEVVDDAFVSFIFKDHLGSVDVIADLQGNVLQSMSFDVWGARRAETPNLSPLDGAQLAQFNDGITSRGYTGHEMLDALGLIHMNGRIYDAKIARFMQADPFVQVATDAQMYNRYSYLRNNPLNATDPSGYFSNPLKKFGRGVIRSAVKVFGPEVVNFFGSMASAAATSWCGGCGVALWTYEFNRAIGASSNDALRAGAIAGVSAYAFSYIGGKDWGPVTKAFAHGVVGGVSSYLQGGKFGHGFVSAGLTKLAMGAMNDNVQFSNQMTTGAIAGRVITAALLGGTISKATGGKFANGAITAGLGQLLNAESGNRERVAANEAYLANQLESAFSQTKEAGSAQAGTVSFGRGFSGAYFLGVFGADVTAEYGIHIDLDDPFNSRPYLKTTSAILAGAGLYVGAGPYLSGGLSTGNQNAGFQHNLAMTFIIEGGEAFAFGGAIDAHISNIDLQKGVIAFNGIDAARASVHGGIGLAAGEGVRTVGMYNGLSPREIWNFAKDWWNGE